MSKSNFNQLHVLIKSLSKAEKRHFKLYAKRNFGEKDVKFLTLFDILDKQKLFNPEQVHKKFPETTKSALSNLRSHLYEQVLISLRLLNRADPSILINDLIGFAQILYNKGLYLQSLEQLNRARTVAENYNDDLALYNITEMERQVELFYVTESGYDRARDIVETNEGMRSILKSRDQWSNLALMLYDYYLKFGHVKNKRQFEKVKEYFDEQTGKIREGEISIHGRVYMHMAHTWFYFITQNFISCYRHATNWVEEMRESQVMIDKDPIMYLKGMHNILSALFYSNKPKQFDRYYDILIEYIDSQEGKFDKNTGITASVYRYLGGLNQRFLHGNFRNNEDFVGELEEWLEENEIYLDRNRLQVFRYKIACMYFGADEFKRCIYYLNQIIHTNDGEHHLKQDVQCFARILNLVAHYELENDELVDYQLKSTYRFLIKYKDLQLVQQEIIDFIKKSVYMNRKEMTEPFKDLRNKLIAILDDPYERRPLLYLDLISWLESKISGDQVEEVIRIRQRSR